MKEATKHSQAHATFAIERSYPVPVAAVWHALSDGAAREAWFTAGDVFTYDMWVDDQHLSTSLTTIALEDDGDRTLLTYVEQGVHFDGLDSPEGREEGAKGLLDQLGTYLARGR